MTEPVHSAEHMAEVRHERTDASLSGVVIFGAVLLVLAIIVHVVLWWMYVVWSEEQRSIKRERYGMPTALAGQKPAEPQLEGLAPLESLREWRKAPEKRLAEYEWADRQKGVARIPIDEAIKVEAMKIVASRRGDHAPTAKEKDAGRQSGSQRQPKTEEKR